MRGGAYQRQRRNAARSRGDCGACCKAPAEYGTTKCAECHEKHRKGTNSYDRQRRALARAMHGQGRFCLDCQASGFHRDGCVERMEAA